MMWVFTLFFKDVGVYLSTTLKKEHLKKVADKQRLNLMTEVHSALTMISKKHGKNFKSKDTRLLRVPAEAFIYHA